MMKARLFRIEVFSAASEAALTTLVNDWLKDQREATLHSISYQAEAGFFSALLLYSTTG